MKSIKAVTFGLVLGAFTLSALGGSVSRGPSGRLGTETLAARRVAVAQPSQPDAERSRVVANGIRIGLATTLQINEFLRVHGIPVVIASFRARGRHVGSSAEDSVAVCYATGLDELASDDPLVLE